jgi:DNA-binding NtrC family response regulator
MGQQPDTRRTKHVQGAQPELRPSGLLAFFPLGRPPKMRFYALWPQEPVEIGRDEVCRICLDCIEVSKQHARLSFQEGHWVIADCGSTNGMSIDGRRTQSARLQGGEVVRVGASFLRFLARGTAPSDCEHTACDEGFVGGPSLFGVRQQLLRAADSDLIVLFKGGTGTGKDVAARFLHQRSCWREGPFVPVNCAAIPESIFESELFGHVKGAFSGATDDARGLFRSATGGTLFLDEISELSPRCQAKLLRVLEDGVVRPVGSARDERVELRVACATNRDLGAEVEHGAFREDLYARLTELEVELPALSDRLEDIPLLVRHFVAKHGERALELEAAALELLCTARWERNVRQLESAVRHALLAVDGAATLGPQHFADLTAPPRSTDVVPEPPLAEVLRRFEGDVAQVARHLGLSRSQVYRRARQAGLRPATFRGRGRR